MTVERLFKDNILFPVTFTDPTLLLIIKPTREPDRPPPRLLSDDLAGLSVESKNCHYLLVDNNSIGLHDCAVNSNTVEAVARFITRNQSTTSMNNYIGSIKVNIDNNQTHLLCQGLLYKQCCNLLLAKTFPQLCLQHRQDQSRGRSLYEIMGQAGAGFYKPGQRLLFPEWKQDKMTISNIYATLRIKFLILPDFS